MDRLINILNGGDEEEADYVKIEKPDKKKKKKKVKSVKIKPVIKIKDDYTKPPHPHLLRLPFSLLLIAPKGSGKTTVLQNLLTWYYTYFDKVFIFSPTINIDRKWRKLTEKLRIPDTDLFNTCKERKVLGIVNSVRDFNRGKDNKEKIKVLLIFDDCVELLPKGKRISFINKLAMNHRHYNISHIIVSQSFKKLDPVVRLNTTGTILYNTDNSAERLKVVEELCGNLGKWKFEKIWMDCVKEKFGFMYLNYDQRLIYKNFDKVVADMNCDPEFLFKKMKNANIKMPAIKPKEDIPNAEEQHDK